MSYRPQEINILHLLGLDEEYNGESSNSVMGLLSSKISVADDSVLNSKRFLEDMIVKDLPLTIASARRKPKYLNEAIFGNLPTKLKPVVIIPRTADGDRYDCLVMFYRKYKKPLIVAIDLKSGATNVAGEAATFNFGDKYQKQCVETTKYFATNSYSFSLPGQKKPTSYDFAYVFYTSKTLQSDTGQEVSSLHYQTVWLSK
jgi:hypothetical protein